MNGTSTLTEKIKLVDDAVALRETERIPIAPVVSALPFFLSEDGTTYKDSMYNYPKAIAASVRFYSEFMPDGYVSTGFSSGKANELAGSNMIDWPGRPGTKVPDYSTHQVIEHEYMLQEEYHELLSDFTGFMLRKYIPRAYPNLSGLSSISFNPTIVLSTSPLSGLYSASALSAYDTLREIAKYNQEAADAGTAFADAMAGFGIPPLVTGAGEAPFDILSDYYRGTIGALQDQVECPDLIEKACDLFADIEIAGWEYFKYAPLPVKRVFFPLHKGMDGFMSPEQYERLYWRPLKKVIDALIAMDVTPYLYTEGRYNSRIEQLADVPKGKTIIHFETADMAKAKKVLGNVACISGNMPIYLLEWGTKQQVIDEIKRLIDICAPGGGYIFDTNASIENAKRENIEAMFETVRSYGSK
jgi:hypothetical protein